MKYFLRKMYFSIFASLLVIITVATTTFAWYSSNQNALISDFTIGISDSDDASIAQLKLSIDGINFDTNLNEVSVMKAVLKQKGYNTDFMTDTSVRNEFAKLSFKNATPKDLNDLNKGFQKITRTYSYEDTSDYLSLDLYISIDNDKYVGLDEGVTISFQNVEMVNGEDKENLFLTPMPDHPLLGPIPQKIKVNPVNAARIGVVTYEPCERGKPEERNVNSNNIYSFSSNTPSISKDGVYNFGGINNEYNAMIEYYNSIMTPNYGSISLPREQANREDELVYGKKIIEPKLGLTSKKMVKVRFYIWMEGWDSDCFNAILGAKSGYAIKLTTGNA